MSIIIRLQNLPWAANSVDIRKYFQGLSIPEGGVHIVGGEKGDSFIAFSTDEDARQAMERDSGKIKDVRIKLLLSSRAEMQRVIEQARSQHLAAQIPQPTATANKPSNGSDKDKRRSPERERERRRSPDRSRRDKERERDRSPRDRSRRSGRRDRSRSRSPYRPRDRERERDKEREREKDSKSDSDRRIPERHRNDVSERRRSADEPPRNMPISQAPAAEETKPPSEKLVPTTSQNGSVVPPPVVSRPQVPVTEIPPQWNKLAQEPMVKPLLPPIIPPILPPQLQQPLVPVVSQPQQQQLQMLPPVVQPLQPPWIPSFPRLDDRKGWQVEDMPPRPGNKIADMPSMTDKPIGHPALFTPREAATAFPVNEPPRDQPALMGPGMPASGAKESRFPTSSEDMIQERRPPGQLPFNQSFRYRDSEFEREENCKKVLPEVPKGPMEHGDPRHPPQPSMVSQRGYPQERPVRPGPDTSFRQPQARNEGCIEIKNIGTSATPREIKDFFYGLHIPPNCIRIGVKENGEQVLLVHFSSRWEANEALKANGKMFGSQYLEVNFCPEAFFENSEPLLGPGRQPPGAIVSRFMPKEDDLCVVMKGLPYSCTEDDIINFFDGLRILDIYIEYTKFGRATGTGYVEFGTPDDFHAAMAMNRKMIGRRYIELSVGSKDMMQDAQTLSDNRPMSGQLDYPSKKPLAGPPEKDPNFKMNDHGPGPKEPLVPAPGPAGLSRVVNTCISLAGLPNTITDREIADFFNTVGVIPRAIHIMLGPGGMPTGHAFAEFETPQECEQGLRKNGVHLGPCIVHLRPLSFQEMSEVLRNPQSEPSPPDQMPPTGTGNRYLLENAPARNPPEIDKHPGSRNIDSMRGPPPRRPLLDIGDHHLPPRRVDSPGSNMHPKSDMDVRYPQERSGPFSDRQHPPECDQFSGRGMPPKREMPLERGMHPEEVPLDGNMPPEGGLLPDRGIRPEGGLLSESGFNQERGAPSGRGILPERGLLPEGGMPPDRGMHPDRPGALERRLPDRGMLMERGMPPDRGMDRAMPPDRGMPYSREQGIPPEMRLPPERGPGQHRPPLFPDKPDFQDPRGLPPPKEKPGPNVQDFGKPGCVLTASNIPYRAGVDEILSFFRGFNVSKENIMRRFNERQQPTGDARIAFPTAEEAEAAYHQLNMKVVGGREIVLGFL